MAENKSMYYNDYLQLDKVLDAQHPESFKKEINNITIQQLAVRLIT
jgi:tryptophan 2,3-dioxygenase